MISILQPKNRDGQNKISVKVNTAKQKSCHELAAELEDLLKNGLGDTLTQSYIFNSLHICNTRDAFVVKVVDAVT